ATLLPPPMVDRGMARGFITCPLMGGRDYLWWNTTTGRGRTTASTFTMTARPMTRGLSCAYAWPTAGSRKLPLLPASAGRREPFKIDLVHMPRQSKFLQRPDAVPVHVDFVPLQAMPRGDRMRMMIVVPAFTKRHKGHQQVVGGEVFGRETPRSPQVCD